MADPWAGFSASAPASVDDALNNQPPSLMRTLLYGGRAVPPGAANNLDFGKKALDLLGRLGHTTQAAIAGGDPWSTFKHGATPEESDAHRATIRSKMGLDDPSSVLGRTGTYARSPHWQQGLVDAGIDFFTDPLSIAGGSGVLEKGANLTGKAATFGAVKGANAVQRAAVNAARKVPTKIADPADVENAVKGVGKITAAAYDAVGPRNRVTRQAVTEAPFDPSKPFASINKPFKDVDTVTAMRSRARNTQTGFTHAAQKAYDDAVKGLSDDEKRTVFQAIDKGAIASLPADLQKSAQAIRDLYRGTLHVQGARTVRKDLAADGFQLPDALKPFDTSVRGIFTRANVRQNYMPHGRRYANADLADIQAESRPGIEESDLLGSAPAERGASPGTALDASDPSKKARVDLSQLQDVNRQNEINRARFATAGRSIAGRDASRELAKTFGRPIPVTRAVKGEKPDVGEVYRAAVAGLNPEEKRIVNMLQQGAKPEDVAARVGVASIPKHLEQRAQSVRDAIEYAPEATQSTTGAVRHDLADVPRHLREFFLRDPAPGKGAGQTALNLTKSVADAPKYGFFFNPLRHMANITQLGVMADPWATFQGAGRFAAAAIPGRAGEAARASQGRAIESARSAGAIPYNTDSDIPKLIESIPGVSHAYNASNKVLWGYDEAQKATRFDALFKDLLKAGHPQAEARDLAAARVGEDLLDYGSKSSLTKAAGYVAPFASYRTKMPGAIMRGIARHPERPLTASRTFPALTGPDQEGPDGSMLRNYLPMAETLRGLDKPEDYLRSTLSYPYKDALSLAKAGRFPLGGLEPDRSGGMGADQTYREQHYYTYGRPVSQVLPSQILGSLPGGDEMLTLAGLNPFSKNGIGSKSFEEKLAYLMSGQSLQDFMRSQIENSTANRVFPPR